MARLITGIATAQFVLNAIAYVQGRNWVMAALWTLGELGVAFATARIEKYFARHRRLLE